MTFADLHPRFHRQAFEKTLAGFWRLKPAGSPPVSTMVVGEWPVCDRRERVSLRYHLLARALLLFMAIDLIGVVIVSVADIDALRVPLGLGLVPGSFPIGLVLFVLLLGRSARKVVFRPIYDERFAFVRAHPDFRAAIGQDDG
ncbi:hypothetical protein OG225_36780 [Nocardia sp. NBC_01377]|uniref:hypothetical protein n=1 Tax=Nocardia sp. NBC_01377 TaxID=2903595 RepID=UPI00324F4DD5